MKLTIFRADYKMSDKTKVTLLSVFLVLVSFGVYFRVLTNDFVWDDMYQIVDNPWITDAKYLPEIFSKDVWGFDPTRGRPSNYYRPLMYVVYMGIYRISGLNPWGYHLASLSFHSGVTVVVFLTLLKLLRVFRPSNGLFALSAAFAGAMIFAAHPAHTEAVAWIAALPDLMYSFFFLSSFYFYLTGTGELRKRYFISLGSFFLATLCKEPAVTLPALLIAYDHVSGNAPKGLKGYLGRYVPFLLVIGGYLVLRMHALTGFAHLRAQTDLGIYGDILASFPLFAEYLRELFFPVNLRFWHPYIPPTSYADFKEMISIGVVAVFFLLSVIAAKRARLIFLGALFFLVPLLPALYIRAFGATVFGDRYLYLPLFGYVVVLAQFFLWIKGNLRRGAPVLVFTVVVLMGLYSAAAVSQCGAWKNNYTFFEDNRKKSPSFWETAFANAVSSGAKLLEAGQLEGAIEAFRYALALDPGYVDAYNKLGIAYARKGLMNRAIEEFRQAIALKPAQADAHNNLANAFLAEGLPDQAIEEYLRALQINPDSAESHYNLALAYKEKGSLDDAITHLEAAARLNPGYPLSNNVSVELEKLRNLKRAMKRAGPG